MYILGRQDAKQKPKQVTGVSGCDAFYYDTKNNIFIVMRLNKEVKKKSVNVVWLQPE